MANSILLIAVFLVRKYRLAIVQRLGWIYLLLAFPAVYGLFLFHTADKSAKHSVFLCIFLAFLLLEWTLDHLLKADFRSNLLKNWKLSIPDLSLYYAMNYGFIVMPWRAHPSWGVLMLGLFVIQVAANISSHPKAVK